MKIPIIIFHHGLFVLGDPPQIVPAAIDIAHEQMEAMRASGLLAAASEIHIGINGTREDSGTFVDSILPLNAHVTYHGLQCRNECRTILMISDWVKKNRGPAYILYEHQKGCTHPPGDLYRERWRNCMMLHLVSNWNRCVSDMQNHKYDMAGCHWQTPPMTPPGQYIFAGNFWWATSNYLATLPPITQCPRIRTGQSDIDAIDTRFEAEVWIGSGPRLPRVRDYHPRWSAGIAGH